MIIPIEEFVAMKDEVEKCFQFLSTLRQGGEVYVTLLPVLDNLRAQVMQEEENQKVEFSTSSTDSSTVSNVLSSKDHEAVVIAAHIYKVQMCEATGGPTKNKSWDHKK